MLPLSPIETAHGATEKPLTDTEIASENIKNIIQGNKHVIHSDFCDVIQQHTDEVNKHYSTDSTVPVLMYIFFSLSHLQLT